MEKRVFLAGCPNYEIDNVRIAVRRILENFGGAEALSAAYGKKVLLKVNLVMALKPEDCATTHPSVVQALSEEFVACGCHVVIADSPGGLYNAAYLKRFYRICGMEEAALASGAELNDNFESREVHFPEGVICQDFTIIEPVLDADLVISVGKLKTHGLAYMTGAMKNMFGAIPGLLKPTLHSKFPDRTEFCRMLVDVCECTRPGFAILDAVGGMEGRGPTGGRPKKAGLLLGGINPHAVDLAGCRVMGFSSEQIPFLVEANNRGFIPLKFDELDYFGDPPKGFEERFVPAIKATSIPIHYLPPFVRPLMQKLFVPYPLILNEKCTGCGACAQSCPEHIIDITDRKAVINYDKCIKCYCCHEFCPAKAIEFKRFIKKVKNKPPVMSDK